MILLVISDLMRDDGGAGVGVQGGHQLPQHQGHESGKNCTNYNQSGGQILPGILNSTKPCAHATIIPLRSETSNANAFVLKIFEIFFSESIYY